MPYIAFMVGMTSRTMVTAMGPTVTTKSVGRYAEEDREDQFDAELGCLFLGDLASLNPHVIGVTAQAGGDAGAEPVRLDQHRHQLLEVLDRGAVGQIAQRFDAALAGLQLQVDEGELLADLRMRLFKLLGNLQDRLVEPEARLHADHQQVQRVRQSPAQLMLAPLDRIFTYSLGPKKPAAAEAATARNLAPVSACELLIATVIRIGSRTPKATLAP